LDYLAGSRGTVFSTTGLIELKLGAAAFGRTRAFTEDRLRDETILRAALARKAI
jgi:hypothetical protein